MIVLTLHLIVCIGLIGLGLGQRSEGGALGMGGGGGGSLMSGRGAADALAKMTSVAGGFFLVTSLTLTMISGTAQSSESRSVFDALPASISRPAAQPPAPPPQTTPDPLEGNALQIAPAAQQASAELPARASSISLAPAAAAASTRAGPVEARPATAAPLPAATAQRGASVQQAAAQQPRTTNTTLNQPAASPPPAAVVRPPVGALVTTNPRPAAAATTQPAASTTTGARLPALNIPNTSGAGGSLEADGPVSQLTPESSQADAVEAVRRERAGPDQ